MIYKNPSKPVEDRVKDLLSRMTLDEKIAQMTWASLLDVMTDRHTLTFSEEKASANIPHGCGYLNRIVETELNLGRWRHQQDSKHLVEKTRLGIPALRDQALRGSESGSPCFHRI